MSDPHTTGRKLALVAFRTQNGTSPLLRCNGWRALTTHRSMETKGAVAIMPVSKRLRYEVLKRDNHTCRYCGGSAPDVVLTVDHVTPTALGGTDEPSNLVAACRDCNAGKSSTSPDAPLVADVSQRAVEWGKAIEVFNGIQMADRKKRAAYVRRFSKAWDAWRYGPQDNRRTIPKPSDWEATIWQFYGLGLPIVEVEDAVTIAAGNRMLDADRVFRYMCGVLWNKVNAMQEGAKAILEAGDG